MNIDEKIKKDLLEQSKELDGLMAENESLGGYLSIGFSSGLGWLVKIGYLLAIALSILLIYCAYQFFTAPAENEVFWGVCLILSFQAQVATKLWIFMQSNRSYLSKELRLLEYRRHTA
jgi:hypothetical protein